MADKIEHINATDTLNEGRKKINEALGGFQTQIDTIVVEGDSSVEAAQARVTKDGETYGTLKERLDGEHSEVTQQLAENEQEINKKMDKGTTNISVSQINKNKGLLDESYFTEKTKEQWTGNTPISSTPIALGTTTQKIADRAVTGDKTDFITTSSNLFNDEDTTKDKTLSNSTGELIDANNVEVSNFIPVNPSTNYIDRVVVKRGFYDDSFDFIEINEVADKTSYKTPDNCYYMRVSLYSGMEVPTQVNQGDTLLPHEPFYKEMENVILNASDLKKGFLDRSLTKDKSITSKKLDFVEVSNNIYNEKKVKINKNVNKDTGNIEDGDYLVSELIPVEPSTYYSSNFGSRLAYYDENKDFIRTKGYFVEDESSFRTESNVYYIRVIDEIREQDRMLNEGKALLPYEPYYMRFKGFELGNEEKTDEEKRRELVDDDLYIYYGTTEGIYTSEIIPAHEDLYATMHTDVYQWYDDLMTEYPNYITRKKLGENTLGNPVFQYEFKPVVVENEELYKNKQIKFILVSGVHGEEKAGVYNLFNAMEKITKEWQDNELLETLRHNIHFVVVPVVNVYSYDNIDRKNENGVDIARNFPTEWRYNDDLESNTYGGEEPLSELDAQMLNQVMEEHSDAIFFTSHHNFWSAEGTTDYIWNAGATYLQVNIAKNLVRRLSRKWKKDHDILPQDGDIMLGYSTVSAPRGSEGMHATSYGMQGGTFEISQNIPEEEGNIQNSSLALTLGVEALINFLILNLKHNVDYYNKKVL